VGGRAGARVTTTMLRPGDVVLPAAVSDRRGGSYSAFPAGAKHIYLPSVMRNWFGWTTSLMLQNTSGDPADTTVSLYPVDTGVGVIMTMVLPPYGAVALNPDAIQGFPDSFLGSGVVSADVPLAAIVNNRADNWDLLSYTGISYDPARQDRSGASALYAPLIFQNYNDWQTALQVQNLGDAETMVEVTYHRSGDNATWSESAKIKPNASAVFAQAGLPQGFVGSAVIRSRNGQALGAIINHRKLTTGAGMSYEALAGGASVLNTPLILRYYFNWSTGVAVQNVGVSDTTVTLRYTATGSGQTYQETATLAPGAVYGFDQRRSLVVPASFVGSADNGQPVVALVNEVFGADFDLDTPTVGLSYDATDRGSSAAFAPLMLRNRSNWTSGLQVQNLGSDDALITVDFRNLDGSLAYRLSDSVPAGGSKTYETSKTPALPDGWLGSASVRSENSEALTAVVNLILVP